VRHAKLAAYEHELIRLVHDVHHVYLWGRSFVIKTDHYSLKFLLDQCLSTVPQHQWTSKLLGYDFHVEFKPVVANVVADALSCRDTEASGEAMAISGVTFKMFDTLRHEFNTAPDLRTLRDDATAGKQGPQWQVVDSWPTVNGKVFIPSASPCLTAALEAAHGVGHEGIQKTIHRFRADFFVHGARGLVKESHNCTTCQRNKGEHLHPA
jgi:hypothetical protein